jgi:hypothetical protein
VSAKSDRLAETVERLQANELMPPVKSVESAAGGIIRVIVVGTLEPDERTRLTPAMGSTRWKLVETLDDRAAGAEYRRQSDPE